MKCKLVYLKSGKMWCKTHEQALMYVYELQDGTLGYRCQVGEDSKFSLQTSIIELAKPSEFALKGRGEE
jgi:hypothetical protein